MRTAIGPGLVLLLAACMVGGVADRFAGLPVYADVMASAAAGASPGQAPLAPVGISAKGGKGSVSLSWTASAGATSYNIYYARSSPVSRTGGTRIAGIAGSSQTVRRLLDRKPYFFVVTAVNASGESGESSWVMAAPRAKAPKPGLVRVRAGPFRMGDSLDDTAYALPAHTVDLDEFWIDRYETTYALWKEVYEWALGRGYDFDNPGQNGSTRQGRDLPVVMVSWYDAVKWLNARSEKEGRTPVYYTEDARSTVYRSGRFDPTAAQVEWEADGYRLPTEAEWEKAARGGLENRRYPWGDELEPGRANHDVGCAVPVGLYPPNGYGLYDTAGNVFEWVWDWGSEQQAYSRADDGARNPRGPDTSAKGTRIRRGGGFSYGAQHLKCFGRMFRKPTYTAPYFGFRSASRRR